MNVSSRIVAPLAAGVLLVFLAATPAAAASSSVSSIGELQTALADCATAPNTITLSGNISAPAAELMTGCDTTIDLGVHNLTVRNIIIGTGTTFEITGPVDTSAGTLSVDATGVPTIAGIRNTGATFKVTGGEVRSTSGNHGGAIGGGVGEDAGTLLVAGGTVHAVSTSAYGAAIGGGYPSGNGGVITVTSGSVVAETPSFYGVAVGGGGGGGGNGGAGATVTVTGGSLTATATGYSSTAIGGGDYGLTGKSGSGGSLVVGPAGTVTASSPRSALGSGFTLSGKSGLFGKVQVDGTLYLPSGGVDVRDDPSAPHEIIVGVTGRILGNPASPAAGANITGTGRIDNQGSIALSPPAAMVAGNNRLVTFDTGDADIRVFAASFDAGYRTLPASPVGTSWNTASDGMGTWFTSTSLTSGTGTTLLYSVVPATINVSSEPSDLTATAGIPYTFPATAHDPVGAPLSPQPAISYTSPDCTITGGNVFEAAGRCTIDASAVVGGTTITTTFHINIVASPVRSLTLTPSAPTVAQGGSLTFTITGEDAYGNRVDTSAAILSSSVPTDEITGHKVTFPKASPHRITAALGDATDQVTITVIASPLPDSGSALTLSKTGIDEILPLGLGGINLLLMGALGIMLARHNRRDRTSEL